MDSKNQVNTASWINLIVGAWLIVSPFVLNYDGGEKINDIWIGLILGVIALIRLFSPVSSRGLSWINMLAGIWLVIAPFALNYLTSTPKWNDVIFGLIVLADAIWNYLAASSISTSHRVHVGRG